MSQRFPLLLTLLSFAVVEAGICPVCGRHWVVNALTLGLMAVGIAVRKIVKRAPSTSTSHALSPAPFTPLFTPPGPAFWLVSLW